MASATTPTSRSRRSGWCPLTWPTTGPEPGGSSRRRVADDGPVSTSNGVLDGPPFVVLGDGVVTLRVAQ